MRKICFITGTRADYGIMAPIMRKIDKSELAELQIIATAMHLSERHGMTVRDIENDGFFVNKKIECLQPGDSSFEVVQSMSILQTGLATALNELQPDVVVILGDRSEALAAAVTAAVMNIPIAHIHGGETTEGAIDDLFRHAITKLSTLHFAATEEYAGRIARMGEAKERIFYSGAPGIFNIVSERIMSLEELEKSIGFALHPKYVVAAYHPVTKDAAETSEGLNSLLKVLDDLISLDFKIIMTLPNSDAGGMEIAEAEKIWASGRKESVFLTPSLGSKRYLAALGHCAALIGNSSSGLIEAPTFLVPTVNIGTRQKGRVRGDTVIDTSVKYEELKAAVLKATSPEFSAALCELNPQKANPYFKINSVDIIADTLIRAPLPSIKPFIDN